MTLHQKLYILIGLAYLIGSIPFGLVVGLAKGIDPRKQGSGNIGATNVGRLLGGKYFALVFTLDVLKSLIPMLIAGWLIGIGWKGEHQPDRFTYVLWLLVGFAAFIGHLFPIFLGFKGGKGVSTACGILLGLWPFYTLPGLVTILSFLIAYKTTRYISVGSLTAAVSFPTMYLIFALIGGWGPFDKQLPLTIFSTAIGLLIIWKHRGNIARLRAGTENRAKKATES